MFKKDLLIPALLALGLYAQGQDINLCNNTTMLLLLYVVLQDRQETQEVQELEELRRRELRRSQFPPYYAPYF